MRLAIVGLLSLLTSVGCGQEESPDPFADGGPGNSMEDAAVANLAPIEGAPAGWTVALAMVEPTRISSVPFEVPGMVAEVRAQVGDMVEVGQVLARLETEERAAKLATARELYRSARAAAPRASEGGGPPTPELEEAVRRRLERVRESARLAPGDRAAVQRAAKREGEEAARDLAISIASRRNQSDSNTRRANRRASDASLAGAVASELGTRVRNLEDAVAKSILKSPIRGLVLAVNAQAGEQWNTRDPKPTFEIVDPSSYVARVSLPSARALRFVLGEDAWVELPAEVRTDQRTLPAVVFSVSSVDVPIPDADGFVTPWREVSFKLPTSLPSDLIVGDEVRVAFAP